MACSKCGCGVTAESARAKSDEANFLNPHRRFYSFGVDLQRAIDNRINAAAQCGFHNTFFTCTIPPTEEEHEKQIPQNLRERGFRVAEWNYNENSGRLSFRIDWSGDDDIEYINKRYFYR